MDKKQGWAFSFHNNERARAEEERTRCLKALHFRAFSVPGFKAWLTWNNKYHSPPDHARAPTPLIVSRFSHFPSSPLPLDPFRSSPLMQAKKRKGWLSLLVYLWHRQSAVLAAPFLLNAALLRSKSHAKATTLFLARMRGPRSLSLIRFITSVIVRLSVVMGECVLSLFRPVLEKGCCQMALKHSLGAEMQDIIEHSGLPRLATAAAPSSRS